MRAPESPSATSLPTATADLGVTGVELRELRYFVVAAEELHFTRAAQRLQIAQQSLSTAIRRLEDRLGAQLLDRSGRAIRLTPAGNALLPFARRTLASADRAIATATHAIGGADGHLALGVGRAAVAFADPIMRAVNEQFPRAAVEHRQGFVPALVDELRGGGLDAVIVDCAPTEPGLSSYRLSDEPAIVVMDANHRLAASASLRIEDLRDELLVLAPDDVGRHWRSWVLGLFEQARLRPATVESSGFDRPAGTEPGETVAISCAVALDWIPPAAEGLVRIPLPGVTMPFDLVWRADDHSPAVARLRAVAERTADRLGWPR